MARQLSGFTFPSIGAVPAAYARITAVQFDRVAETAVITLGIWYSAATRQAAEPFLQSLNFNLCGANLAAVLSAPPQPGSNGTVPTEYGDIITANAYVALLADPDAATLLAGSTAV
jgi:hypothetical protein